MKIIITCAQIKWFFLNNGQIIQATHMPLTSIPDQYIDKYSDDNNQFPVYLLNTTQQVTSISYQIDSYCDTEDDYGSPLLSAPWGGVLGFLGTFYKSLGDTNYYQENIDTALEFGLFMAKDELLEGPVQDYIINKVAVADGYQTNNTFFQFMPQLAAYDRTMNTARYNQVHVAQGADTYVNSAEQFGWKEYYFYNGGLYYANSPYGNLPYDPASSTDSFSTSNSSQTNAGQYPSLMSGQLYCERTLISQGGDQPLTGYEVARAQTYYYGFSKYVCDPESGEQLSVQQVVGVVPTLTVTYSSPSITTYADITDALTNNCATLNYSYTFYDYPNLYGPWVPTTAVSNENRYCLWLKPGYTLNTVLPLGTLTYTYSLLDNKTKLNATYTQSFPGVTAYVQGTLGTSNPYYAFVADNLYSSRVQTMTWQLNNVAPPTSFALPSITWGDGWEVTSSQVTTWTSANDLWYPNSSYIWQGNANGTPQTSQFNFPWLTPPTNGANEVWVQGNSVSQISSNGIVLSKTNSLGIPTFSIYDQQYFKTLAAFTNAGLAGGAAFYIGFETFENLSPWSLSEASQGTLPLIFSTQSYTGNRSLSLNSNSTNVSYQLSCVLTETTFNDSRNWVLAITLFSTTEENPVKLQVSVNGSSSLLSKDVTLGNSWTTLYLSDLDFSTVTTINSINIGFSFSNGTILIDNLYLVPATETSFAIKSYDSATNQLISTATLNDRTFTTRYLYDNLNRPLGTVRKGVQPNEIDVVKLAVPYYSRVGNQDSFNANNPNALLTLTAGLNSSAGYYFDFRDGLNPWNGGTVNNRLLILNAGESASFTSSQDTTYGFGIQVQLQGYIQNYSYSLSDGCQAIGLPAPTLAYSGGMWGCYANSSSPNDICFYSLTYDGSSDGIIEHSSSLNNYSAVFGQNFQPLVSTLQNPYYGVFIDTENGNNGLYNIFVDGSKCIVQGGSDSQLFPVSLVKNNLLYISDQKALYCIDTNPGPLNASLDSLNCKTIIDYSSILEGASCSFQPTAGGVDNSQIVVAISKINIHKSDQSQILLLDTNSGNIFFEPQAGVINEFIQQIVMDSLGNIYAIGRSNVLYAFDNSLSALGELQLTDDPLYQPVCGNGFVAIVLGAQLNLYTPNLSLITEINVGNLGYQFISIPVINGDKISIALFNSEANEYLICSYNTAGLLTTAPYVISGPDVSTSVKPYICLANYSAGTSVSDSSLVVLENNSTISQISIGVPSARLSMGPYSVSWDSDTNQFSLTGPNITVDSVTVASTQGNWLFFLVNPYLYFYADGQQIFAIPLDLNALPTGDFTITAGDNALSCRDIILINDPSLQISYRDGENKVRQVQQIADVVLPQQTNSGV